MAIETNLLVIGLCIIGGALVLGVMRVLDAWTDHHLARHDLIRASKTKRLEYLRSLAELEAAQMRELEEASIESLVEEYAENEPGGKVQPQDEAEPAQAA